MSDHYTTQDAPKTLEQMVDCARREANLRKQVYPRWVQAGRLTHEKAAYEIECMESIYYTLFRLKELQDASDEIKALEERHPKETQEQLKI